MKFRQTFIPNMTAVALLIAGLSTYLEHVSALESPQAQLHELSEAKKALQGEPSSMKVADVINGINEGKLNCTTFPPNGYSLISYALSYKNKDVTKACVAQCTILGTCLEYVDSGCRTILHWAALSTPELLKIVLDDLPQWDVLLNVKGYDNLTPIAKAVLGWNVENVQILKEAGADLTLKTLKEWTALEWARSHRHQITTAEAEYQKKLDEIIKILSQGATIKL